MIRQIRQRRQQARQVTDTENRRGTHKTCKKNKTLGARGRIKKPRPLLPGTQVQKALEQSATMGAGQWGERGGKERREGGEEHSTQHTRHKQHKGREREN